MRSISLFFFVFLSLVGYSQTIRIEGRVRDPHGQGIPNAIIVNNRTKTGSFGNSSGYYTIVCEKTDTLSITALSYYTRQLCMKDSLLKTPIFLATSLPPLKTKKAGIDMIWSSPANF